MANQLKLAANFLLEVITFKHQFERIPEPEMIMNNSDNVREYYEAGLVDDNGSSVYLLNMLMQSGSIKPGMQVVDLAFGPANLLIYLAKINPEAQFIGVDLSTLMLKSAEELKLKERVTNIKFVLGDITKLNMFGNDYVDLVTPILSLHHLPELSMLKSCFHEIARIVRCTGTVHLMDFAALKRAKTIQYSTYERTKGLGKFLSQDYENSLHAAYRINDIQNFLPIL